MKDALREKKITKTFRNGMAVFQLDYIVRLRSNIRGDKFSVTEQRAQLRDEKIVFWGKEKDAKEFYDEFTSVTFVNGSVAASSKVT